MALLTVEIQDKLTTLLVDEGLVTQADVEAARAEATKEHRRP